MTLAMVASLSVPAQGAIEPDPRRHFAHADATELTIQALAKRQREEMGIPDKFLPFLRDDAKVRTGREMFGKPVPDFNGDSMPEVLETDLRYSYTVGQGGQEVLPTVESETSTRITVRAGATGKKLWGKRFTRDAYPFSMRLGKNGRYGVVVISGIWNFYGTTEENTLRFDAFDGRRGKPLWSREYSSVTYYDLLTTVQQDSPLIFASFDGIEGRADDLMVGFATQVSTLVTTTMATRVVVIDGTDGGEHIHPLVDVGVDWWPIPLPTKDLDRDGLEDYATTNRFGVDLGEGQETPTYGGTVYARKGTDGTPIWTTSGVDMEFFAFTNELPDVVADRTPDLGLSTYVAKKADPLLPVDVPLLGGFFYEDREYLLEGRFGNVRWHKAWEWMYSPGDIDSNGKADLLLGKFHATFKKGKTVFEQLAVDGNGDRLWQKRSVWRFETMPCPKGLCFGGYGWYLDGRPDVQPDHVNDVLFGQVVQQNEAFEDSITRLYDGRTGHLRFEDEADLQSAEVAIDGHGTDLVAFEPEGQKIRVTARNGMNEVLWGGLLGGPDQIVPRKSWFYAMGFRLPGDDCGDLVIDGWIENDSGYSIFNGADGRLMWWRWTGPKKEHPTFTQREDHNSHC